MSHNLRYFLALNRIDKVGPRTIAKLWAKWPNLADLFNSSTSALEQIGLKPWLAKAITQFDFRLIEADLAWGAYDKQQLLTLDHSDYPKLLKEIYDPPAVLYAHGDLSALEGLTIAIVGSRKPSVIGAETARRFATELAQQGITIVSGLALGIDVQVHQGCLEAKGKTIAVMGTGVDYIYPRQHLKIAHKIIENGLLLSEFPLKTPPTPRHFPRRNRIISGLSLSTLVIEAAIKSGSLITARYAMEQNRDVMAVPGSIYNDQASGCHYLLQQGAKLVTTSREVLEELSIPTSHFCSKKEVGLASERQNLVKCIGFEVTSIDQLVVRSGISVDEIISELAELELEGLIKPVAGGYMRCMI